MITRSTVALEPTNTMVKDGLKDFEKYEVTNRLDKLKEFCNKKKTIETL